MRNKLFYGLGLLTMSTFAFMVNTNALTVDKDTTLTGNVNDGIVVESGSSVTINLGGFDVSNVNSGHTIEIKEGATAVITGKGNVTNSFGGKAFIYNEGTLTLKGGTYNRVVTNNDHYVLENHGKVTIEGGTYSITGGSASLFDNGWTDASLNTSKKTAEMIINGGRFEIKNNDKYIKNDDFGKMIVNDGTFVVEAPANAVIANAGTTTESITVNGGDFTYYGTGNPEFKDYAIWDVNRNNEADKTVTIVNGGKYTLTGASMLAITNGTLAEDKKEAKVIGSDDYVLVKEDELVKKTEVNTVEEESLLDEEKELFNKVINEKKYNVAGYYGIDLYKATEDGLKIEQLSEVDGSVSIKLQLPSTLAKVKNGFKRTYYVIRIHDGVTTIIDAVDNGDGTISFKSDKFSTYSVVYNDTEIKKVTNPDTADNVLIYFVVATISLVGLSLSGVALKKRFN